MKFDYEWMEGDEWERDREKYGDEMKGKKMMKKKKGFSFPIICLLIELRNLFIFRLMKHRSRNWYNKKRKREERITRRQAATM